MNKLYTIAAYLRTCSRIADEKDYWMRINLEKYQFALYKKNTDVQITVFKSLSEMYEVLTGWETDLQFQIIECKILAQEQKHDI